MKKGLEKNMVNNKYRKVGLYLSYFLDILMIILLILSIWQQNIVWIFGCSLALFVSLIPSIVKRNYEITLPLALDLLITVALLLHVGGGLLNIYHTIPFYDAITHFVSSFLVAFLAFVVIYILHVYWEGLIMDKYAMAFVVVLLTISMGVIWEFNEWITDIFVYGGLHEQWGYNDTIKDLFIDMIAGIVMAIIGVNMIKKGSFDQMTREFGKQIDKKIISKTRNNKKD